MMLLRPTRLMVMLVAAFSLFANILSAETFDLPQKSGDRPQTTAGIPHVQIGVKSAPKVKSYLLSKVSTIPNLELRPTVISLPGAEGFWLNDKLKLKHPEVIVGGREFAHIHPDGSLHASLPVDLAKAAVKAGWAIPHPWANKRAGWEGFVMIYTPHTNEEADVVFQLIVASYNYITGENFKP